jgi:hypothetical protein
MSKPEVGTLISVNIDIDSKAGDWIDGEVVQRLSTQFVWEPLNIETRNGTAVRGGIMRDDGPWKEYVPF